MVCTNNDLEPGSELHTALPKVGAIVAPSFVTYCLEHGCIPPDMTPHLLTHPDLGDSDLLSPPKERKVQIKNRPLESSDTAPTPAKMPSTFASLGTDILCMIGSFIPRGEGVGLWRLGHKSIQQQLTTVRTVHLVPRVANSFNWPVAGLSYYRDAKEVTVACPEYYEHMPLHGFSSADIPNRVHRLTLTFRNAALLFNQVKVLRDSFPHLESLKLLGIDGPKICFSASSTGDFEDEELVTVTPAAIEGISRLSLPSLEIALSDIDFLPQSLIELSMLHIVESGDGAANFIPKWPQRLESVSVNAGIYGGAVLDKKGLGLSSLKTLTSISVLCHENPGTITDECISRLPITLRSLELLIGCPEEGEADPEAFAESDPNAPLSGALFSILPPQLESLEIWHWPVPFDYSKLDKLPKTLTRFRVRFPRENRSEVEYDGEDDSPLPDYALLPRSITDLAIPVSRQGNRGRRENLQNLPPNLTRLMMDDLHPILFRELPRSITDLDLWSTRAEEEGGAPEDDEEIPNPVDVASESLLIPPNIKRFYVEEPDSYDSYLWPFAELMPNLEYMHVNSHRQQSEHRDNRDEELFVGSHWKHYSDGINFEEEDWIEFVERLPPTLKSFRIPTTYLDSIESERDFSEMLEMLPRGLTALSMLGMEWSRHNAFSAETLRKLPPHLTFLAVTSFLETDKISLEDFPPTLRFLAYARDEFEENNNLSPETLPAYCKAYVVDSRPCLMDYTAPMLRGEWWRRSRLQESGGRNHDVEATTNGE